MKSAEWYVGDRAESLAIELFTREGRFKLVSRQVGEFGIDLVFVTSRTHYRSRLGVEVKGFDSAKQSPHSVRLKESIRSYVNRLRFPVILLVVDVRMDTFKYSWLRKHDSQHGSLTKCPHSATLVDLDISTVDGIAIALGKMKRYASL